MLKLRLQYFSHLMRTAKSPGKVPNAGKDWGQEKRASEDEMAGWHHWCIGCKLGQTSGDSDGQRGLACCSPWGHKESNMTGWLNKNNNNLTVGQKFRHGLSKSSNSETCCSVAKLCPTVCNPEDCCMLSFPVLHHLLEFAKTYVHWVTDAVQPSHPLPPPSLPALNLS